MSAALEELGLPCWHSFHLLTTHFGDNEMWQDAIDRKFFGKGIPFGREEFDQLLHSFGAVSSDTPAIAFADDLIAAYPEAKVILVERDIDSWYKSYMHAIIGNMFSPFATLVYYLDRSYIHKIGKVQKSVVAGWGGIRSPKDAEIKARDNYRKHYAMIRRISPRERLLEFKLDQGWGPLCEFLGKDIPDIEFPRLNESAWFDEKASILLKQGLKDGATKAFPWVLAVLCIWYWCNFSPESLSMATDKIPPPKFLEDLPTEILNAVFTSFCSHCHRIYPHEASDEDKADVDALKALTQTSRRCRSVTLPILLHSPSRHLTSTYILGVFDHEPDLAQITKTLTLPLSGPSTSINRPIVTRLAKRLSLEVPSSTDLSEYQDSVETGLMLAFCSNLERLTLQISDSQGKAEKTSFEFLQRMLKLQLIPGFSKLRHLDIDTSKCKRFSIAGTELSLFLHESPVLETLVLRGTNGQRVPDDDYEFDIRRLTPALRNLKKLQILEWSFHGGTSDSVALGKILSLTLNLKSFKFTVDDGGIWSDDGVPWGGMEVRLFHIPPSRFIEFLKPVQSTLQHLSLNFGNKIYAGVYQSPDLMLLSPPQMQSFTSLESLSLGLNCYCRHLFGCKKVGAKFDEKTCLTELLPPTLRNLTVFFTGGSWGECLPDVLYLGDRVVAGDFQNLQRVTIKAPVHYQMPCSDNWDDYWDNEELLKISRGMRNREAFLKDAFEGSSVVAELVSWYIWEDMY
ncbi:hypothetical protein ACHAPJ_012397 [Fusarium lateritium]